MVELNVGDTIDRLDDHEVTARCQAVNALEFAIHRIPAQTLAGVAVKAKIAAQYIDPTPMDPLMTGILASLVEDIVRMTGVTANPSTYAPLGVEEGSHG
jgi:hypothetical protein